MGSKNNEKKKTELNDLDKEHDKFIVESKEKGKEKVDEIKEAALALKNEWKRVESQTFDLNDKVVLKKALFQLLNILGC